ncbi:MAG: transcription termination factor NusA [Geminicoccaceae bacterium]|nr:transcription termination factor NusA [Geminicoccaceae bacterium]MCS7268801.1 transcription termination factor NusA [Geminicoccaceae bacterium]MCX7630872.1 transcription termination factor NusA [Geminicoccaceae bacterium]MDW8125866.1 transcription termination factor NusA [Geminicoccaceae bacterium]MDW8340499.1 transcription termination factor NusA [Geminicoccaceae bacterium]
MESTGFGRGEILRVAEAVAQEKGISTSEVIAAMEQAIQTAARRKYGMEHEIVAEIDRRTGEIRLYRELEVVEQVENPSKQITLDEARERNPAAQIGDHILEPLPAIDLGRIAAQSAKQVIVQKVRDAERERQYNEYKDRIGEIVVGEVKRVDRSGILVDLGRAEAFLRHDEMIPREIFHVKDRIRAYIYDVRHESRGPQIFLSRTHPGFMIKLFEQEVPEIYDGIIEIKACARDPGSRAKIAVYSRDSSIDPVGACVGMRGSRVQAVVQELGGEKVDIIPWSPDPATFVCNALAPAEVSKVVLDPEAKRIEVIVPDHMQHIAIGRRGQNVRLASQLTGWDIDIVSESEDSERRQREFKELTEMFVNALNVDEVIAQLLVSEGIGSVEELALVPEEELARIEGFDEEIAQALKERAQSWLEERRQALEAEARELGVKDDLLNFGRLDLETIIKLARQGIKSLEDLADLAGDELAEMLPGSGLSEAEAGAIVMDARVRLGWVAPTEAAEATASA